MRLCGCCSSSGLTSQYRGGYEATVSQPRGRDRDPAAAAPHDQFLVTVLLIHSKQRHIASYTPRAWPSPAQPGPADHTGRIRNLTIILRVYAESSRVQHPAHCSRLLNGAVSSGEAKRTISVPLERDGEIKQRGEGG